MLEFGILYCDSTFRFFENAFVPDFTQNTVPLEEGCEPAGKFSQPIIISVPRFRDK